MPPSIFWPNSSISPLSYRRPSTGRTKWAPSRKPFFPYGVKDFDLFRVFFHDAYGSLYNLMLKGAGPPGRVSYLISPLRFQQSGWVGRGGRPPRALPKPSSDGIRSFRLPHHPSEAAHRDGSPYPAAFEFPRTHPSFLLEWTTVPPQTNTSRTTCPCTSVRRKSRPSWR